MLACTTIATLANVAMASGENNANVSSPLEMKYSASDITPEFVENNFSDQGNYVLGSNSLGTEPTKGQVVLPMDNNREFKLKLNNGSEKSYLLLDKDSAGNYFVVEKTPLDTNWRFTGMSNTYGNYTHGPNSTAANGWKFDAAVASPTKSIAYYLNDFTSGYAVPAKNYFAPALTDYLVETDWSVGADSARDYTGEQAEWSSTKRANNPVYTTRGKLALLSAQEYITYLDILGYQHTDWRGTALRTSASRAYRSGEDIVYSCGPMIVYGNANNVRITYGERPDHQGINIQACFWVNSEFFKEVKLEAAGADVVAEMLETIAVEKLLEVYGTDGLLSVLGINHEELPMVENIKLSGTPSVGTKVDCLYDYSSVLELAEYGTEYLWYLSVDKDTQGELVQTTSAPSITIESEWVGKYLKAFIVPRDSRGQKGLTTRDCEAMLVLPEGDFAVADSGFDTGKAWVKVSNLSGTDAGVRAFLAAYNNSGNIISITPMLEGSVPEIFECNMVGGASQYKILVLTSNGNQPLKKILK